MANEVTVTMPLALTPEMIRAVRDHETTKTDDRDEWHRRLGWLLCAWDVILEQRRNTPNLNVVDLDMRYSGITVRQIDAVTAEISFTLDGKTIYTRNVECSFGAGEILSITGGELMSEF